MHVVVVVVVVRDLFMQRKCVTFFWNECFWNFDHKFRKISCFGHKFSFGHFWLMGLAIDDFVLVICWHRSFKGVHFSLPTNGMLENECFWNFEHKFRKIHKKLEKYAFEDFWVMGLAIWTFEGAKRRTTSRHAQRALCES